MANGLVAGMDAKGQIVRVGDTVNHTEKSNLRGGIVEAVGWEYKGEVACGVRYPAIGSVHKNRLSKLVKVDPKTTLEYYGFKVGDHVWHKKYNFRGVIDSTNVGEYKGEPCCFLSSRPTRFSQIEKYNGQDVKAAQQAAAAAQMADQSKTEAAVRTAAAALAELDLESAYFEATLADGRVLSISID